MTPPSPIDLGLPPKFISYRRYSGYDQLAVAMAVAGDPHPVSVLQAPTGSGKSVIGATVARLLSARTLVLVGTKGLQSQWHHDFAPMGMVTAYGHCNYPCKAPVRRGIVVAVGDNDVDDECSVPKSKCGWLRDMAIAAAAPMVVANYALWMSLCRYADPSELLGDFDLLICDEAHTAPEWLSAQSAITIYHKDFELIHMNDRSTITQLGDKVETWVSWARSSLAVVGGAILGSKAESTKVKRRLRRLSAALDEIGAIRKPTEWVVLHDAIPAAVVVRPLWGTAYGKTRLFRHIPKIVAMSATVTMAHMRRLGVDDDRTTFTEIPSPFHESRRPVIFMPAVIGGKPLRIDYRMTPNQREILVARLDDYIGDRIVTLGKGIIHSRSYDYAREIVRLSRHRDIMITYNRSSELRDAMRRYRECVKGILVGPSFEEGFDFPGDLARWQVIWKVMVSDNRDPLTKARTAADVRYKLELAASTMMQICGRIVRSEDDWGETLIMDDHLSYLWWQMGFPQWFRDGYRKCGRDERIPSPMVVRQMITIAT